jgi:hypothetical protein
MSDEAVQAAEAADEKPVVVEETKPVAPEHVASAEPLGTVAGAVETPAEDRVETPAEAPIETAATAPMEEPVASTEDVSYQSVEKEGTVTAIWEMQGQRHLRTIDPRSIEGKQILALFETAG